MCCVRAISDNWIHLIEFLGNIPVEFIERARVFKPAPSVAHGQSLVWGGGDIGFQGVTELQAHERCRDPWPIELQQQFRNCHLSKDMHRFLHGAPTSRPGSWEGNDVTCGQEKCRQLAKATSRDERKQILKLECAVCRNSSTGPPFYGRRFRGGAGNVCEQ